MSSTKDRVRRLFNRKIVPAAEKLRRRGISFFPLGAEPEADSWYVDTPQGEDFEQFDASGPGRALAALWEAQELPELSEMLPALMEIAEQLKAADKDGAAEVSPFIYVMY